MSNDGPQVVQVKRTRDGIGFFAALLVAIAVWVLWAVYGSRSGLALLESLGSVGVGDHLARLGQLGDSFGAINALFTAMAFAGVVWTGLLQRRDLALQAQELSETRDILRSQSEAINLQQFEGTFFQLLRMTREMKEGFSIEVSPGPSQLAYASISGSPPAQPRQLTADSAFAHLAQVMYQGTRYGTFVAGDERDQAALLTSAYNDRVFGPFKPKLSTYFRCLYQVFKLADEAAIGAGRRVRYTNIARAQLTEGEVLLLALNGLTEQGGDFKVLVERYGLLKHMSAEHQDSFRKILIGPYQTEAFAGSAARDLLAAERDGRVLFSRSKPESSPDEGDKAKDS